ncbi:WD40 repeat-like protein, partial [Mycena galericulata]
MHRWPSINIRGGTGGSGGSSREIGGSGGTGEGPRVQIHNNTFFQSVDDDLKQLRQALTLVNVDDGWRRSGCLDGTRQDLLQEIIQWLETPSGTHNILWLHGVAGCGKSTISTSIFEHFHNRSRLGASIFLNRTKPAGIDAQAIIHSIAYWLANANPQVRATLCETLVRDPVLVNAPIGAQFRKLLLEPLVAAKNQDGPTIVIILDALDEIVEAESRRMLVSLLANQFRDIPPVFRFLITSRPDSDIASQFQGKSHITPLLLNIATATTKEDIILYLHRYMPIHGDDRNSIIEILGTRSGGLFIWAATACKFLGGHRPKLKLALLLSHPKIDDLYDLYTVALDNSAPWTDIHFPPDARAVLSALVLGQEPLTDKMMDSLLGLDDGTSAEVLECLGCVVQWAPGRSAQILHTSFRDYLTDFERSGSQPWFVKKETQSRFLALGCFHVLQDRLRFNICGLKNSHVLNSEVLDLPKRKEQYLSADLSYASRFWGNHLQNTESDNQICAELRTFMETSFLYWLEVLSLLEQVSIGSKILACAQEYVKTRDEDLELILYDAQRFLNGFAPVIAQSVPHIYISALPLAPLRAKIREIFAPKFPRTLHYTGPLDTNWLNLQKLIRGHTDSVGSVAFSPDGRWIVSGSNDKTVCIWDSETGAALGQPFTGHTNSVLSVAFSSDGKQIVSGSRDRTVRIWDSQTGATLGQPLMGHTDSILSVAFSPDGKQIASGAEDRTMRIWDSETGAALGQPLAGHTDSISSVTFSSDGKWIASGSHDRTIRIWDLETGTVLKQTLMGHKNSILSVIFSPDGKRIASSSRDRTVRIWDLDTGTTLGQPLKGHTAWIYSVTFSPDGKRIASGSGDRTVRIWDSITGTALGQPLTGHTDWVNSVAFSPDGKRIVSGSSDRTVCIWDSETGTTLGQP